MAFKLNQELDNGVDIDYWRIGSVVVACSSDPLVTVYMEAYLNRDARYNGKTSLKVLPVNMKLSDIDPTFDFDFRACIYNSLQQFSPWNQAKLFYEFDEKYDTAPIVNFIDIESDYNGSVNLPSFQGQDLNNLPLTYEIVDQPTNGTIVENNGVFTYTPNSDWFGNDVATYRCSNGTEFSKKAKIYLKVDSDVPSVYNISGTSNYNSSSELILSGEDPNDLPLSFSIVNQPTNGIISENNGVFTYTPNLDWAGSDIASYKANNGTYDSNTASINLYVAPVVPTANEISSTCELNGSVDLGFNANDPNNLPLTFVIVNQPSNGTITENNGVFTYVPNQDFTGVDTATYKANNGTYDSNIANITITVNS